MLWQTWLWGKSVFSLESSGNQLHSYPKDPQIIPYGMKRVNFFKLPLESVKYSWGSKYIEHVIVKFVMAYGIIYGSLGSFRCK